MKHANTLANETSPYLLQHAQNPVHWQAWNPKILDMARQQNRLLLISIGYAACHWCHVMEHECFEDEEVAQVMNQHFVNIKVDREERPDVDQIYMDALQIMTGSGGWPLNIVALPDGRPFWGATYVKKENWINVLQQLSGLYQKNPGKVMEYAENLSEGLRAINVVEHKPETKIVPFNILVQNVHNWSEYFDTEMGGHKRAPKFMMPVGLNFLLHFGMVQNDRKILEHVHNTLTKMAWGGVYDHVGGGFSRYSVDTKWHVPHFEKMLYDNGQLASLYAKAYAVSKKELYREVVRGILGFVEKVLMDTDHGFYSSLDADSLDEQGKLEEGAFYVWREKELKSLLGKDFPVFQEYFSINDYGHWEHGNYVLIRNQSAQEIADKNGLDETQLDEMIQACLQKLDKTRNQRERPRLDDKILTSWNGLMLKGLVDAYRYLGEEHYLDLALKNARFIHSKLTKKDGGLYHNYKNGKRTINGYLEDYACVIDAFIGLYEVTFEEKWLARAKSLLEYCLEKFRDPKSGLFFFTSSEEPMLVRRTLEIMDNVIPASNSIMAKNLFKLSKILTDGNYGPIAEQMLVNVQGNFEKNPQSHANWMQLVLYFQKPFYEIAVVGNQYLKMAQKLGSHYLPNCILAATPKTSGLPLLKNRFKEGETLHYVCEEGACKLPITDVKEALDQVRF